MSSQGQRPLRPGSQWTDLTVRSLQGTGCWLRAGAQGFRQFLNFTLLPGLAGRTLLPTKGLPGLLHLADRPRQVALSQLLGGLGGSRLRLAGRFRRGRAAGFLRRLLQRLGKCFLPGLKFLECSRVRLQLGQRLRNVLLRFLYCRQRLFQRSPVRSRGFAELFLQLCDLLVELLPCGLQRLQRFALLGLGVQRIGLLEVTLCRLHRFCGLAKVLGRLGRRTLRLVLQLVGLLSKLILTLGQFVRCRFRRLGHFINGVFLDLLLAGNDLIELLPDLL